MSRTQPEIFTKQNKGVEVANELKIVEDKLERGFLNS